MKELSKDDKVKLIGSNLTGSIRFISDDGFVSVGTDDGCTLTVLPQMLEVIEDERDSYGRFQAGHIGIGPKQEFSKQRADARQLKQDLLNELAPFLRDAGKYIKQIAKPEKKLDAIVKLAPYCMPALSRVEYTDETPRQMSVEQGFLMFMQQHGAKPKNTESKE